MILKRFYDDKLAHASYLVGCPGSGEAVVVDPHRDVDLYLNAAAAEGLRIAIVTETHIHADYVSGSRELARRAGATLYLSDEGDPDWKYAFAHEERAHLIRHGDTFKVGGIRFDVVRTPGHTPEHISFVVTDESASQAPLGIFTGDFVFVGDVGRPDLLETAAGHAGSAEPGARQLYASLAAFKSLPDHVLVWPAHGAGSACGKSLGGVPMSSVGYERRSNWALRPVDEAAFVKEVLEGQPDPPKYFAVMKRVNKEGPRLLGGMHYPPLLPGPVVFGSEEQVLDVRTTGEYVAGHLPGTVHIPLNRSFSKWAGSLLDYGRPLRLIAADENAMREAVRDLRLIGLDDIVGWWNAESLQTAPERLSTLQQARMQELADGSLTGTVLDVRGADEWREDHVPGSLNLPLNRLEDRLQEVPRGERLLVHCESGARSAIAVSLLERHGYAQLVHLVDNVRAYRQALEGRVSSPRI